MNAAVGVDAPPRYGAFISYSHMDAAFGRRLHRRLETYRIPRRLVGRSTARGRIPPRLAPIFRDREELAAAGDLTQEVRAALAESGSLVVVCSRAAAASVWVGREVEVFRELHPDRPVLAAILEGDPAECFPEALRRPDQGGEVREPLAADFRHDRDGPRLALLKLIAGALGIGLDELVQRDAQRRVERVMAVTGGSVVAVLAMGLLTIVALTARAEALRQRTEAEGLVEFMLTDLRTKLRGVGRLDVMSDVNRRALAYYAQQDLARLAPSSLERRARALLALGEDDEARGDHIAALANFHEARRTTLKLMQDAPGDPERIYDHAQSEFWLGLVDYNRGRSAAALPAFRSYKSLADRLVTIEPDNPRFLKEAAYAEGSLCSVALEPPHDLREASRACSAALARMEAAAKRLPTDSEMSQALMNRHAWVADAYRYSGDHARALEHRLIQQRMLDELMRADPRNADLKDTWISLQRALSFLETEEGQIRQARARLLKARSEVDALIALDPANQSWVQQRRRIDNDLEPLQLN